MSNKEIGNDFVGTITTNYKKMINKPLVNRIVASKYEIIELANDNVIEDLCYFAK